MNKNVMFIRLPRCGGTSIVNGTRQFNIPFYGGGNMGFFRLASSADWISDEPTSTSDYLHERVSDYVGTDIYEKSYKFSTIRNPFSRAVSMFNHSSWESIENFKEFCYAVKSDTYPTKFAEWHSSTLTDHILSGDKLKVDQVIRLENFQEDFNVVCDKIGIPRVKLPHKRNSKSKHYTEYYDDETREIVAEKYAKDIEYFAYKFDE